MTTLDTTANKTERDVENEVKAILTELGANASDMYVSVNAMHKSTGRYSFRQGAATGQFTIDMWGVRASHHKHQRGEAAGKFRTTKDGVVPVEKIRAYAEQQLGYKAAKAAFEKQKKDASKATEDVYNRVVAEVKQKLPKEYFADYRSTVSKFITNDTSVDGKVAMNVGTLVLDETQASALINFLASLK